VTDTDVIIVGAGPAGLMLASELCLAGVRPLVLERRPGLREAPKANGFNGQIVELLRYRGLLGRVKAAAGCPDLGSAWRSAGTASSCVYRLGCDAAAERGVELAVSGRTQVDARAISRTQ